MNVDPSQSQDSEQIPTKTTATMIDLPITAETEKTDAETEKVQELPAEDRASLDKVRDLLFGAQARESDKRLSDLETALARGLAELRKDLSERIDALDRDLRGRLEKLDEEMLATEADRTKDGQRLSRRLEELRTDASRQLHAETKRLLERIEDEHQKTVTYVDHAVDKLEDAKSDREALAQMFAYLASRLEGKKSSG